MKAEDSPLVVGNSGTKLETECKVDMKNKNIIAVKIDEYSKGRCLRSSRAQSFINISLAIFLGYVLLGGCRGIHAMADGSLVS